MYYVLDFFRFYIIIKEKGDIQIQICIHSEYLIPVIAKDYLKQGKNDFAEISKT